MRLYNQEFRDGKLIREEVVDVPDPEPTPEELLAARLAAITEALAESGDAKLVAVADAIVAKGGTPVRPPKAPRPSFLSRSMQAVTDFVMAPFRG